MKISSLFIAMLFYGSTVFSQTNYSSETLDKIKEVENNVSGNLLLNGEQPGTIKERMAKYNVKGMSIAVIHDYKIAWAKGYGWADESEKRPVTQETLFEPGSISKTLNAIGILKLAQDKKVDLYTDINTYLSSWKFPYDSLSNGKKISLANLLSHTAGLSVHGFPGHNINGPVPTLLQVLDGKKPSFTPAVRSMFEPDLKFQYSGGGTSISQIILTDLVGQPYEEWMYNNVLKPIGMIHSTYAQPPAEGIRHLCASAYNRDGSPIAGKFHVYPEQAAAGLWMTPSDLSHYIIDMQLAHQGKPSAVLIGDMVKLHLSPYNDGPTALGTFIEDHDGVKYFQHSAGNDGFCGQFYGSMEDGYGVVIFMNTDFGKLMPEVINSVAKAYNWKNFYREPQRKTSIEMADKEIKAYEGIYLYDDSWAAIGKKDNEYHFFTDWTYAKMYFISPTGFFNEEFQANKNMIKDEKGNVVGYTRMVGEKEYPRALKVINPDTTNLSNQFYGDIGWYYFETKKYKEALTYFSRGTQVYPEDLNMLVNRAHMYLFNNEYNKARDIYKAHLTNIVRPGYSWEDLMREDYTYFKDKKYDMQLFDRVFDELKVKKP
ncbi:MAG: beta-lactamase family protein [Saprospiraceae bacterium]|jgi:CubicO group peptidase (beta-lactamase class C family)|nr:beta-lactamase family protein [Saprospiraceae bacterium]